MFKAIQVGIGGMGNAWLHAVTVSPDVEFAGFVEVNAEIARTQAEKYNLDPALIFPSLDRALAAVRADFVIVVTPPRFHRDVSITALAAGVPVLSEKPLADTRESALDTVRKSNETGVLHVVSQNYRYRTPIQTLKKVLDGKTLGPVASVTVEFFRGPHFGGFREEMPYPLITDMSIHHFDLMRFLLDADPISIFGRSWNPPWSWFGGDASASVLLEFPKNVILSYNGSWCSNGGETSWNANWRFDCEKGVLALQDDLVYRRVNGEEAVQIPPVPMEQQNQAFVLRQFCAALESGHAPRTTCQDNIKSLGIVFDTITSFATGQTVRCAT